MVLIILIIRICLIHLLIHRCSALIIGTCLITLIIGVELVCLLILIETRLIIVILIILRILHIRLLEILILIHKLLLNIPYRGSHLSFCSFSYFTIIPLKCKNCNSLQ